MQSFMSDLRRGLCSCRFLLAVVLCAAIYLLGAIPEKGTSDMLYLLDASVAFSSFYHLFPVVAVLPLGCGFLEDIKSGYIKFILQRTNRSCYLVTRFTAATLLGALATVCGMLLFLLSIHLIDPMVGFHNSEAVYPYMEDFVRQQQWGKYIVFYAYLQWISGMMWSSISLVFSSFVESSQMIYLSVVLSMEMLCRILWAAGGQHIILYAIGSFDTTSRLEVLLECSLIFYGITFLCFFCFYFIGNRRLQYA